MTEHTFTEENDPQNNIRSDLWTTMDHSQLKRQQEIITSRMSALYQLMGRNATPSLLNIYGALQVAMTDLTYLIDHHGKR